MSKKNEMLDVDFYADHGIDIGAITYRLHPIDVGFSLVTLRMTVEIIETETLTVSYCHKKSGGQRIAVGPFQQVIEHLRKQGYTIKTKKGVE